jgi:hypothetical protein
MIFMLVDRLGQSAEMPPDLGDRIYADMPKWRLKRLISMKIRKRFAILAVTAFLPACDNRNTDSRDLTAPESVAESQVTHPNKASPTPSPSATSEEQHKAGY